MFNIISSMFLRKVSKNILLVFSLMMVFSLLLTGCAGTKKPAPKAQNKPAATTAPTTKSAKDLKIGVVWVGKSGQADKTFKGFEDGMKKLAPELAYETKKEIATIDELGPIISGWEKEKDGIVLLRSNGIEWLSKNSVKVPVFVGGCNRPDLLGLTDIENKKITGSTYYVAKKGQFEVFKTLIPNFSSILFIAENGHPSTPIERAETEQACKDLGIKYSDKVVSSKDELNAAVKESAGKVSAIVLGTQALTMDNSKAVVENAGITPVIGFSATVVQNGGIFGYVPDDEKLGSLVAETIMDTLVKGKTFKEVQLKSDDSPKLMINETTLAKLNFTLPAKVIEAAKLVK